MDLVPGLTILIGWMILKLAGVEQMVKGWTWNIPASPGTMLNDLGVARTSVYISSCDINWDNCEEAAGGN